MAVGNIYFPQAISPLVAAGLDVSPDRASWVVTAIQIGYTAGMFLVVPLGDRLPHRPLLVTLLALTGAALLAAGCAPSLPFLVAASACAGWPRWPRRSSPRWRPGWWRRTAGGR